MLWGKTNKVRSDLHLLAEICLSGVSASNKALRYHSEHGKDQTFLAAYEGVCQQEKDADQQVFLITQQLYSDFLLPDSREDLARLVHQADTIIDMAHFSLKLIVTRNISFTPQDRSLLFELLETTEKCVAKTTKALMMIMGPQKTDEIRALTQEISNLETLCDTYQEQLISQIYSSEPKSVDMLLQSEVIDAIAGISDACEDTAVIISIMNVKRIA